MKNLEQKVVNKKTGFEVNKKQLNIIKNIIRRK